MVAKNGELKESKPWFESKTIILSLVLAAVNVIVLAATYVKPVFEDPNSSTPVMPVALWVLLLLNAVFCFGIAYMRKISDKKIS